MRFFSFLLIGSLLLAGCQQRENTKDASYAMATLENQNYMETYIGNPQIPDDRTLLKKGDTIQSDKGFMTLKKANFYKQVIDIDDIRLTVYDTKQMHLEPTYSMIDYFHSLTEAESFDIIKAFVTVENRGTETVNFSPVETVTHAKTTQTFEHDIYLDKITGLIKPGELKQGNIGYIVQTNATAFEIQTSAVYNQDGQQRFPAETFSLRF